jgi:hypothetical protein
MEIIIILFLLILCGLLIYAVRNSINKIEFYENFINDRRQQYEKLLNTIREIDSKELFEKDDDVGAVFTQIKDEIESFENILD